MESNLSGSNRELTQIAMQMLDRMPQKGDIPQSNPLLRKALLAAYGGQCPCTGKNISNGDFHVDHIWPKSKGGPDNIWNYLPVDPSFNIRKSDRINPAAILCWLGTAAYKADEVLATMNGGREPFDTEDYALLMEALRIVEQRTPYDWAMLKAFFWKRWPDLNACLHRILQAKGDSDRRFLLRCSRSSNSNIRRCAAQGSISKRALAALAKDEVAEVRREVAPRAKDPSVIAALSKDPDPVVRLRVAHNPAATAAVLSKLSRDSDLLVGVGAATNPMAPPSTVAAYALADDPELRMNVAEYLSPECAATATASLLLMDPHPLVNATANFHLGGGRYGSIRRFTIKDGQFTPSRQWDAFVEGGHHRVDWRDNGDWYAEGCYPSTWYSNTFDLLAEGTTILGILGLFLHTTKHAGVMSILRRRTAGLDSNERRAFVEELCHQTSQLRPKSTGNVYRAWSGGDPWRGLPPVRLMETSHIRRLASSAVGLAS